MIMYTHLYINDCTCAVKNIARHDRIVKKNHRNAQYDFMACNFDRKNVTRIIFYLDCNLLIFFCSLKMLQLICRKKMAVFFKNKKCAKYI